MSAEPGGGEIGLLAATLSVTQGGLNAKDSAERSQGTEEGSLWPR